MTSKIPIFSLVDFSEMKDVFCVETQSDTKNIPLHLPYRTEYYGFGIVVAGQGVFNVNLETYQVQRGSILSIPPDAIKQWINRSGDLKTITIFFTKSYFLNHIQNKNRLEKLEFFQLQTNHIISFSPEQSNILEQLLYNIKDKLNSSHPYRNEIVANLLNIAFYEYAIFYNDHKDIKYKLLNRSEQITLEFKKLLTQNFIKERSVKFYGDLLFISSKHLSETITAETGRTAGEWITELVILEAKILLQDPTLNIAQITNILNFTDQSTFGKFFKNKTGFSPLAYRQTT